MKKLIVGCAICAIVLTASTYAWFIGMKTVQVSSFDVSIAAIDGLSLSLDGIITALYLEKDCARVVWYRTDSLIDAILKN